MAAYCIVASAQAEIAAEVQSAPKMKGPKLIVFVTCANRREAAKIARAVVEARFAACANILPGRVHSIYRWKGKVESARETMMILKTSRRRFDALRRTIERLHSYDTPEIVALPITSGARKYLAWIEDSLHT